MHHKLHKAKVLSLIGLGILSRQNKMPNVLDTEEQPRACPKPLLF